MPSTVLKDADFENGQISAVGLLVACGLASSRGEARRLIQQGGVSVADKKVTDIDQSWSAGAFRGEGLIIKKGKKVFHRAAVE
jgi:tyrosyl-tRNA synthetase